MATRRTTDSSSDKSCSFSSRAVFAKPISSMPLITSSAEVSHRKSSVPAFQLRMRPMSNGLFRGVVETTCCVTCGFPCIIPSLCVHFVAMALARHTFSGTRFFTKCMEEYRELEVISLRSSMRATVGNSAVELPAKHGAHVNATVHVWQPQLSRAQAAKLRPAALSRPPQPQPRTTHQHPPTPVSRPWMLTRNKRQKSCLFERKMQSDTNVRVVCACSCCVALSCFGSFSIGSYCSVCHVLLCVLISACPLFSHVFGLPLTESPGIAQCNMRLGNYIACRLCRILDGSLFCSHTRGRGLTFTSAHVLVRAPVDGPGFPPSDIKDHTQCVVRALVPTLAVCPPHVCHRQRDWAVSLGWHMQQDMGISKAPPHPGAPFPLTHAVHVRKPRYIKSAIVSPETWLSFVSVTTRVFRPAGRILHSGVTKIITIHKVFFM